jgi:AcrR family transcriptional regulator
MADEVKSRRRYDSTHRREQAASTRAKIVDAAQRLFVANGYVSTSMAAIAAEAGVALKTVYDAFETKSGVLSAVWNRLLRGDDEPVPVGQRDWYREVLEERDPRRQLQLNARNARVARNRLGPLLEVIRTGAPSDPDVGALWERIQSEFHDNQRAIVATLAKRRALKKGLDVDAATDLLWTLNHPSVYHLLVGERGWAPERYEQWLGDVLCSQLLR